MRITFVLIVIMTVTVQLFAAAHSFGQVLDKKISLSYSRADAYTVITNIQQKTGVSFAFTDDLGLTKITVKNASFRNQRLEDVLKALLPPDRIGFMEKSGTIVLYRKQSPGRLTGTVTDSTGAPLGGAHLSIVELNRSFSADRDGRYSISLSPGIYTVEVRYLSYVSQQRRAIEVGEGRTTTVDFVLRESPGVLDEVVVVGYGRQAKINLTGAVNTVNNQQLENRPITQASQSLQGLAPGVFVNTATGEAGNDESNIVIRGVGSLNQSSQPLVLIDGIEGSLNDVLPSDIERISVLKDAAAASIYGTRGAKGVILIVTKRGGFDEKSSFSYNAYAGFSQPTVLPDMVVDNRTYLEVYRQAAINSNRNFDFDDDDIERYAAMPQTDYRDLAFKNAAPLQNHEIAVKGGAKNIAYFMSLGYLNQDGWLKGEQNFKRYNVRTNVDARLSEKAIMGVSLAYVIKDAALTPKDDGSLRTAGGKGSTIFSGAIVGHPIVPAFTPSGFYANLEQTLGIERNRPNVQGIIDNEKGQLDQTNFMGNAFLEYRLLDGLKAKLTMGVNMDNEQGLITRKQYQGHDMITERPLGDDNAFRNRGSYLERTNTGIAEVTNTLQIDYEKIIGKHDIKVLAGGNRQTRKRDYNRIRESEFGSLDLIFLGNGTIRQTNGVIGDRSALLSMFGRVNYAFDGKYLLEANFRRDGSSRFGVDNRWGNFPSFSAGWIVSKEDFWGDRLVSHLKLRGSWGVLGSESSDRFGFLTEFQLGRDYIDQSGGAVTKLGNPKLKWEETTNGNIGFNAGFFKDRLSIEGDYFVRKTTDILVGIDNPLTSGVSGETTFNAASMQNKGWEASFSYQDRWDNWAVGIGANVTHVKNSILAINPDLADDADRIEIDRADNVWWIRGEPINVIYGHRFAGVFQSSEEINDAPDHSFIGRPAPGDIRYTDQNGDGVINLDDRVVLGNRNPEWFYGINFRLSFKQIELSALLQGTGNAYVNLARETGPFPFAGLRSYWLDAWTEERPNNEVPRVWVDRTGYNGQSIEQAGKYSSFWMQNMRYARLKNVQIAYHLPNEVLRRVRLTGATVFANGQNLLTFTPLLDFEPERDPLQNHATATLPQSKIVTLGVNLTF